MDPVIQVDLIFYCINCVYLKFHHVLINTILIVNVVHILKDFEYFRLHKVEMLRTAY